MGGFAPPKVPDYRIYKVQDAPPLMQVQERLAKHGLKDPWLRNDVWRYTMEGQKNMTTFRVFVKSAFRGFPIAVAATAAIVIGEKIYHKMYPPVHDDHH